MRGRDGYGYELNGNSIVAVTYFGKRLQLNDVVYCRRRGYPEQGTRGIVVGFHRMHETVQVSDNIVGVLWEGLENPWDRSPIWMKFFALETDEGRM
jgi:hypothetical protein